MRQILAPLLTISFIGILLFGCADNKNSSNVNDQKSAVTFDLNEAKKIIKEKTKRFTEAHILKDTAFLNNIITIDARSFPPNSEVVIGRKAISKLNYDWVNYGVHEFTESTTNFYGNEDYLIDEGTYYLRYGEDNVIDKGKYINIWTKVNEEWKIYSNIWNTSLPLTEESQE